MSIASMIASSGHAIGIERPAETRDALGGRKTSWEAVRPFGGSGTVPAWVQDAASAVIESYEQRSLVVTHRVYIEQDFGIKEGDRIVFDNRRFVVVGVRNAAGLGRLWEIDTRES